mmetsp:Transcript_45441/g.138230  ORF Transcript_45441/g.138230 Transcript_45441/m.138230 type:complete len:81 (-) Transcript_45441:61-303(-)
MGSVLSQDGAERTCPHCCAAYETPSRTFCRECGRAFRKPRTWKDDMNDMASASREAQEKKEEREARNARILKWFGCLDKD